MTRYGIVKSLFSRKPVLSPSHNTMQSPCMAQVAGHTSNKTWPAQMRETSDTILAAAPCHRAILLGCLYDSMSMIDNRRQTIEGGVSD